MGNEDAIRRAIVRYHERNKANPGVHNLVKTGQALGIEGLAIDLVSDEFLAYDMLLPDYFYWDYECDGYGDPVVIFDTDAGYNYVLFEDLLSLPGVFFPEEEVWWPVWSSVFGDGEQEYNVGTRYIGDIVDATFILAKVSKPIEIIEVTNSSGTVLGQVSVDPNTGEVSGSITVPIGSTSITIRVKDSIGNVISGDAPIEWEVGGLPIHIGGSVSINNSGIYTVDIGFGDMPKISTTIVLTDPVITEAKGLYTSTTGFSGDYGSYQSGYTSDDDAGRIYSNREPPVDPNGQPNLETDGTVSWPKWDPGKTYVDLTVEIGVTDPDEDWRIRWEFIDPDDPSDAAMNTFSAQFVDPNDLTGPADNDNRNHFGQWEEIPGLTYPQQNFQYFVSQEDHSDLGYTRKRGYTRIDKNGHSKVRFRVSSVGGDNYQVKATVMLGSTPQAPTKGSDTTGIMTVWKLLHLEHDKTPGPSPSLNLSGLNDSYQHAFVHWQVQPVTGSPVPPVGTGSDTHFGGSMQSLRTYTESNFGRKNNPGWYYLVAATHYKANDWVDPTTWDYMQGWIAPNDVIVTAISGGSQDIAGTIGLGVPLNSPPAASDMFLVMQEPGGTRQFIWSVASYTVSSTPEITLSSQRFTFDVDDKSGADWKNLADHAFQVGDQFPVFLVGTRTGYSGIGGITLLTPTSIKTMGRAFIFKKGTGGATVPHELGHALGLAHNCGNWGAVGASGSPPANRCVMHSTGMWVRDGSGNLISWSLPPDYPKYSYMCWEHIEGVRLQDLSNDASSPTRELGPLWNP